MADMAAEKSERIESAATYDFAFTAFGLVSFAQFRTENRFTLFLELLYKGWEGPVHSENRS
jgi:hypothetical protein